MAAPRLSAGTVLFRRKLRKHTHALCVGFMGGGIVGLVGWGGAQVIIPGMTMSPMRLSQLSATGVSLSSLSVSTLTSGMKFYNENSVAIETTLAIAIPSLLSAGIGTYIAKKLSGDVLAFIFNGLSILLIPTHLWIQERRTRKETTTKHNHPPNNINSNDSINNDSQPQKKNQVHDTVVWREKDKISTTRTMDIHHQTLLLQHACFGIAAGLLSALMGVGGLPFTMSYLTEFTDLGHHHVQGTAICSVIPSTLTSAVLRLNAIPVATAVVVAVGSIVGGMVGARIALDISEESLRKLYIGSLVLFGGRSIIAASRNMKNILSSYKA